MTSHLHTHTQTHTNPLWLFMQQAWPAGLPGYLQQTKKCVAVIPESGCAMMHFYLQGCVEVPRCSHTLMLGVQFVWAESRKKHSLNGYLLVVVTTFPMYEHDLAPSHRCWRSSCSQVSPTHLRRLTDERMFNTSCRCVSPGQYLISSLQPWSQQAQRAGHNLLFQVLGNHEWRHSWLLFGQAFRSLRAIVV